MREWPGAKFIVSLGLDLERKVDAPVCDGLAYHKTVLITTVKFLRLSHCEQKINRKPNSAICLESGGVG